MDIREQILAADDLSREPIALPEWGSPEVFVAVMPGTLRDAFEISCQDRRGGTPVQKLDNIRAKLVVRCLVKADGERVFGDLDAEALGKKSGPVLERVFRVARRLNKLDQSDIEELAKNSPTVPSEGSTSA